MRNLKTVQTSTCGMRNESQAPNNKHQIPNKSQEPKSKISNSLVNGGVFGHWNIGNYL
jgi:hypothetical protein